MTQTSDTTTAPVPQAQQASGLQMIVTMGSIGFLAGLLIVMTYQLTLPTITRNKARVLEQAIFEVLQGSEQKIVFVLDPQEALAPLEAEETKALKYYAGYDDNGRLIGVAMEAGGPGFQEKLKIIYGYSPELECVIGMKVLESKETPGLGDKIETDPTFRKNFEALDVALAADKKTMRNPIELVKPGKKTNDWQIDAIAGATISSRAIAKILRQSTAQHAPLLVNNLSQLKGDK